MESDGLLLNRLKRITTQHPEHHFYFIFDRRINPIFIFSSNITPIVLYPQATASPAFLALARMQVTRIAQAFESRSFSFTRWLSFVKNRNKITCRFPRP